MSESQPLTFQNDEISVIIHKQPFCMIDAEVQVTPAAAAAAYAKALKNIKKEVSLPGFRKGKAPEALVKNNYSNHIDREWQELLASTTLNDLVKLTQIPPLNDRSIQKCNIKKHSLEGAEISYKYETRPEAPEVDPKEISLKKIDPKVVTEQEIDEEIENFRFQHAQWTDIDNRSIKEGDYVLLDIDLLDDPKGRICEDQLFHVKKGDMGEWMHQLLIGKKPGEKVQGHSEKDPKAPVKEGETPFVSRHCEMIIKKIRHADLPPIDEELAKKARAESMEKMRQHIRHFFEQQQQRSATLAMRQQLEKVLFEKYPFELPQSLVRQEMKIHLENMIDSLRNKEKLTDSQIESRKEDIMKFVTSHVVRNLHLYFLAEKLFQKWNMEVSKQEMVEEYVNQISQGESLINKEMDPQEVQSRLFVSLMTNKVVNHLIANAIVE